MSLLPDVTAILDDPEVGGGVSFDVIRSSGQRRGGSYDMTKDVFHATGNVQPQEKGNQASTTEDLLNEVIVIYSTFIFQVGSNDGVNIVESDIVKHNGKYYRVTKVDDWSQWGYTRAYATRIMDNGMEQVTKKE